MSDSDRSQRVTATLMLLVTCVIFGAAIGQMYVILFSADAVPGWDRAADRFAGPIIGGLMGGIAGGYLVRDLSVKACWWSSAVAVVLTVGTLWSVALTAG